MEFHPELELKLLKVEEEFGIVSSEYQVEKAILSDVQELYDTLRNQKHHTNSTVAYALAMFNDLVKNKPLTPLTGEDREWQDVSKLSGESMQQNVRCSAVFRRNNDNSTAYYIEGKVFSDDGGKSFYSNKDSSVPITFPCFLPETEKVILENERKEDDFPFAQSIKDYHEKQNEKGN